MSQSGPAADFIARLSALAPLVARHRDSFDRDRRLPRPVFEALAEAGLFRLWLPRALGGPELPPLAFMEVVEAAAALDGSVGWLVGNGGGAARFGGHVPESVARDWFADRHAFLAAVTGATGKAVPMAGGYRVSGRWPFASGIHHASGIVALCAVEDPAQAAPQLLLCHMAPEAVTVSDNWHVSGLRGTGSCDFSAEEVFVPAEQCFPMLEPHPCQPGPLYALSAATGFPPTVAVVPLGIARAAMADWAALAERTRGGTSQKLRDRELMQFELGRAEALHRAARAFLAEAIDGLIAAAQAGGEQFLEARVRARLAYAHAADTARGIVGTLVNATGAAAIFETSGLERRLRDVQAATQHVAISPQNYVIAGRVRLGLDPGTSRL